MLAPAATIHSAVISMAATAAQALPENAVALTLAAQGAGVAGEATALTVVAAAPAAGQIQFAGTALSGSSVVTLNAAPTATIFLAASWIPAGALGAAY